MQAQYSAITVSIARFKYQFLLCDNLISAVILKQWGFKRDLVVNYWFFHSTYFGFYGIFEHSSPKLLSQPFSNFGICLYCCLMILILCIPDFRKIDWITLDCFFVFVVRSTYDFSFYSFMTVTTSSIYKMEPT